MPTALQAKPAEASAEPTPSVVTVEEMQRLVAAASLVTIVLKSSECQAFVYPTLVDPAKCSVDTNISSRFEKTQDEKGIFSFLDFTLTSVSSESAEGKTPQLLFQVKATFVAVYGLPVTEFSKEAMESFVNTNAVFHAFPYFREFAQSMTSRLGVPPITLPLYRISPPKT